MPHFKPSDIATFYTEVAEVSLTNSLLYIKLLSDELDDDVIERHRRRLMQKLPIVSYDILVDLQHTTLSSLDRVRLLLPCVNKSNKVAVLANSDIEVVERFNILIFSNFNDALRSLRT